MSKEAFVNVVGGGLAGSELSYQLAKRGINVRLYEMRPSHTTPAHTTGGLAELVCSNTFKSVAMHSAPGIFKTELAYLGSAILACAEKSKVPAGEALAVDREALSRHVEELLLSTGKVERIARKVEDVKALPDAYCTVLATGPLTQGPLAEFVKSLSGGRGLYFYDAIAPIVSSDSVDREIAFAASRYDKGGDDYLNCPMTKEEYQLFYDTLMSAEKMAFQDFEEAQYFQGCQPIEAIAETGVDSLRFGAMKPVGLTDPRTGKRPWAVVQLRIDNLSRTAYNLVGFQTKLKYGEQKRVFQLIPGLQNAEFQRLGSMHRNTYICSPELLSPNFSLRADSKVRLAGQITGVEGYTESTAIGLLTALAICAEIEGKAWTLPPRNTMLGSLAHYVFSSPADEFQPVNVNFSLVDPSQFTLPDTGKRKPDKNQMRLEIGRQCVENLRQWRSNLGVSS